MKYIHRCVWQTLKCLRHSSTKSPFSDTVLLPKTTFPAKVTAKIAGQEKQIQEACKFNALYGWQKEHNEGKATFTLHDGPPYANGDVHVGHALNKILKDITNRYKMMRGYQVHYIPGWDCHGLPIEIKAIKMKDFHKLTPSEIRTIAREFASKTIEAQKEAFMRWGIMANFEDDGCYFTYSKKFEAQELEAFHAMYKKGFIYRDLKPVYWSPSSTTALAEAELEYCTTHISRSAYISFPLQEIPDFLKEVKLGNADEKIHVMVWTTQPWTIPANRAVCFSVTDKYCLIKTEEAEANCSSTISKWFIVAENQLSSIQKFLSSDVTVVKTFEGGQMQGLRCHHPMDKERLTPLLPSSHVTMEKGTGFVHVAPAHGVEDFTLAMEHGLDVESHVDDEGRFTYQAGFDLVGKFIFDEGNQEVLEKIKENNNLVHEHQFSHSYPYDWRTKKPIFIKTSKQWFVDTNSLRNNAKVHLDDVNIIPASGRASMMSHLKGRTFWCISRQRVWGVPIPVFYHKKTREMLLTDSSIEHIISIVKENGTDAWWKLPMSELLPRSILEESEFGVCSPDDFAPGRDILDIWFDSGVTWSAVLGEGRNLTEVQAADLYLEGKDQYGGWFQSSLLTSSALQGQAPYKNIFVHGFVVSESGQKMSKSIGNVVDPMVVTDGGKIKNEDPAYGADVLRWWVAESNVRHEVMIGQRILNSTKDSINKIRLCFRFLLGNLTTFNPDEHLLSTSEMWNVDRYILLLLCEYNDEVTKAYESFDYGRVTRLMLNFISKLSNFYFTIIKDRLYCSEQYGNPRLSCQTALYHIVDVLATSTAPVLPHTMEEINMHHPCRKSSSIFKDGWCDLVLLNDWNDVKLKQNFAPLLKVRDAFISSLVGDQAVLYDIEIRCPESKLLQYLQCLQPIDTTSTSSELSEIFGCSQLTLSQVDSQTCDESSGILVQYSEEPTELCTLVISKAGRYRCQRCRCFTATKSTEPCERCSDVIAAAWAA